MYQADKIQYLFSPDSSLSHWSSCRRSPSPGNEAMSREAMLPSGGDATFCGTLAALRGTGATWGGTGATFRGGEVTEFHSSREGDLMSS